jgi:hypothetical protein
MDGHADRLSTLLSSLTRRVSADVAVELVDMCLYPRVDPRAAAIAAAAAALVSTNTSATTSRRFSTAGEYTPERSPGADGEITGAPPQRSRSASVVSPSSPASTPSIVNVETFRLKRRSALCRALLVLGETFVVRPHASVLGPKFQALFADLILQAEESSAAGDAARTLLRFFSSVHVPGISAEAPERDLASCPFTASASSGAATLANEQHTLFSRCCQRGAARTVTLLLELGYVRDPNAALPTSGDTPLIVAVRNCHPSTVQALLRSPAVLARKRNAKTGENALDVAAWAAQWLAGSGDVVEHTGKSSVVYEEIATMLRAAGVTPTASSATSAPPTLLPPLPPPLGPFANVALPRPSTSTAAGMPSSRPATQGNLADPLRAATAGALSSTMATSSHTAASTDGGEFSLDIDASRHQSALGAGRAPSAAATALPAGSASAAAAAGIGSITAPTSLSNNTTGNFSPTGGSHLTSSTTPTTMNNTNPHGNAIELDFSPAATSVSVQGGGRSFALEMDHDAITPATNHHLSNPNAIDHPASIGGFSVAASPRDAADPLSAHAALAAAAAAMVIVEIPASPREASMLPVTSSRAVGDLASTERGAGVGLTSLPTHGSGDTLHGHPGDASSPYGSLSPMSVGQESSATRAPAGTTSTDGAPPAAVSQLGLSLTLAVSEIPSTTATTANPHSSGSPSFTLSAGSPMLPAAAALDSTAAPTPALTTPNTAAPTVASPDIFPPSSASHLVVPPPGAAPAAGTAAADEFDEPFSLGESQGLAGTIIPIEITRDDSDTHTVLVTSAPAATKAVGGTGDAPAFTTASLQLPTGEPREPATPVQGAVASDGIAPNSDSSAVPPVVGGGTFAAFTSPPVDSRINVTVSVSPTSRLHPAPPRHAPLGHLMMSPRPPPMNQRARTSSPGTHDKMLGSTALGGVGPNIPSIGTAGSLGGLISVSDDRHTPPLMTAAHPPPAMMMNVRPMNAAGGLMPHPPTLHHHHSLSARLPSLSPAANHPTAMGGGSHTPLPGPTAPPLAFAPAPPASSGAASQFVRGQQQPVQNGQMSEEAAAMLPFTPLGGGNHHYQPPYHQHGKLGADAMGGAFLGLGGLASANASTNVHPYVTSSPQQQSQATGPNSSPPSLALGTESLDATVRSVYRAHQQQQQRPPQASFLMTEGIITTATPTPLPPPAMAEMGGGVGAVGDNNNGGAAGATMVGLPSFGIGTPPAVAVAPASPSPASGTPPPPLAVTAAAEGTGSFRAFGASPALPGQFLLGASPAPFGRGGLPRSFSGEVPGRRGSRGDLPPL